MDQSEFSFPYWVNLRNNPQPKKKLQSSHDSSDSEPIDTERSNKKVPMRRMTKVASGNRRMTGVHPTLLQAKVTKRFTDLIEEEEDDEEEKFTEVATLKAGSSFGELALISSKPRAATIRAKTP